MLIVLDRGSVSLVEASARLTPLLDTWIESKDGPSGAMLFRAESRVAPREYAASGM